MRVLADESVFAPMVEALRRLGQEVVTAKDAGLLGEPDDRVFAAAVAGKHVLLTLDKDFTRTTLYNPKRCGGIIVARLFRLPVDVATQILIAAMGSLDAVAIRGRVVVVTREGVRFRPARTPPG